MIKHDYILRLIEELVQVVARILRLHERGENDAALSAIDDALLKFVGLELRFIDALSLADLVALMRPRIDLDLSRCIVLADLLKARGDVRTSMGEVEAGLDSYVKSLTLYLEIF